MYLEKTNTTGGKKSANRTSGIDFYGTLYLKSLRHIAEPGGNLRCNINSNVQQVTRKKP